MIGYFVKISYHIKALRAGTHCGGVELRRRSDPPQAENLASEILFSKLLILWIKKNRKYRVFIDFFNFFAIMISDAFINGKGGVST